MAYTQAHLDAIDAAIATGALQVRNPDGSYVQYRDLDDMLRTRAVIAGSVAPATARPRATYAAFNRGF